MNVPSRSAMIEAINQAAVDLEEAVFHKSVEPSAAGQARALRAAAELLGSLPAPKPPEPLPALEVAADPRYVGRHPYHDARYIVAKGTELELATDGFEVVGGGSIYATMRDFPQQKKMAYAFAAAPELLEACKAILDAYQTPDDQYVAQCKPAIELVKAAIAKASGPS